MMKNMPRLHQLQYKYFKSVYRRQTLCLDIVNTFIIKEDYTPQEIVALRQEYESALEFEKHYIIV